MGHDGHVHGKDCSHNHEVRANGWRGTVQLLLGRGHHHDHAETVSMMMTSRRKSLLLAACILLNIVVVVVQVYWGWGESTALLADAFHNFSDVLGLALALYACMWRSRLTRRGEIPIQGPNDPYVPLRMEHQMAFGNFLLLYTTLLIAAMEAIRSLFQSHEIDARQIAIAAGIGLVINTVVAVALHSASHGGQDVNLRAARDHMAGDAALSGGVILAMIAVSQTGWQWLDPAIGLSLVILIGFRAMPELLGSYARMRSKPEGVVA